MDYPKRGDIYLADLEPVVGSEQGKIRPVVIIQNDTFNYHGPTVIAAAITSRPRSYMTEVDVPANKQTGLKQNSIILTNQTRTLDKSRLLKRLGKVSALTTTKINFALSISLQLFEFD